MQGLLRPEDKPIPGAPVVNNTWNPLAPGTLSLPSGRVVRGRCLRRPLPAGPVPTFAVHLLGSEPASVPWASRWIRWPDFGLPRDQRDAADALQQAWLLADQDRVEIACGGGRGRTGTALACLAVLDGVPAEHAVSYVRQHYDAWAVEMPWQRRFVTRFGESP